MKLLLQSILDTPIERMCRDNSKDCATPCIETASTCPLLLPYEEQSGKGCDGVRAKGL
jgi:hypothetical protein